jgi:integral membrane protein (TIGR01906 family)
MKKKPSSIAPAPPFSLYSKPIVPRAIVILVAACLVVIVAYAAFSSLLHSTWLYSHLTTPSALGAHEQVVAVLDDKATADTLTFLNADERTHMADVQGIARSAWYAYIISAGIVLGICAVFIWNKLFDRLDELLARSLRGAGYTVLALCVFVGGAALLSFERFWLLFHAVLFPQGNWMFPIDSTIILLYPPAFWVRAVTWFVSYLVAFGVIAVVLSYAMDHLRKHKEHFSENVERQQEAKTQQTSRHKRAK